MAPELAPTAHTRQLYESMTTEELRTLRRAFELDHQAAEATLNRATRWFAEQRMELIAEVLKARNE